MIIPASPDGLKPRAWPAEELLDADGLGTDPVDEVLVVDEGPVEDEVLVLVALFYGDLMLVMGEKSKGSRVKGTLKASNVLLAVGLTAKTIPD